MAEIVKNDKNFLIIKINDEEANKLNFGIFKRIFEDDDNIFLCGSCNVICNEDNIYYISAINEILCEACMEDFVKNMNHYMDSNSLRYEIKHFNHYANILNLNIKAETTPEGKLVLIYKDKPKE